MRKRRWFRTDESWTSPTNPEAHLEAVLSSYQQSLAERLERGLGEIQDRTVTLLHQIAAEVWPTSETGSDLQERVVAVLSRDAAIRGLIAHTDERYQALDLQLGEVRDRVQTVTDVADELRTVLEESRERVA